MKNNYKFLIKQGQISFEKENIWELVDNSKEIENIILKQNKKINMKKKSSALLQLCNLRRIGFQLTFHISKEYQKLIQSLLKII